MASDRSHHVAEIGRHLVFQLGLILAVAAPVLAGSSLEVSAGVAVALAALALACAVDGRPAPLAGILRPTAASRAAGSASYSVRRATDPHLSPRRPRAPEPV
jgi:hypothetical protein